MFNTYKNIELLSESEKKIGNITKFEYVHGKFDFTFAPDFCGIS
jgi:hypothetical protein